MSSTPALSALNAEAETYLLLTVTQIDRLRPFARLRSVERGRSLVSPRRCRDAVASLAMGVRGD